MITGKILVSILVLSLLIISCWQTIALGIAPMNTAIEKKELVREVREILANIFYINMTRYRLDNVELHDLDQIRGSTIENYILTFKNSENYVIKAEARVVAGRILGIDLDSFPSRQDITKNIRANPELVDGKALLNGTALRKAIEDIRWSLHEIYGGVAEPVISVLGKAEYKIPDRLVITKKWNGYKYTIRVNDEYSVIIDAVFMNAVNTPLGFGIMVWRSISMPFKTRLECGVFEVNYMVRDNKTYVNRFNIQPFFANAVVSVPDKLKRISYEDVVRAAENALKKYLEKKGITGYSIESVQPRWINYVLKNEKDHLVIVPGSYLTLTASVRIGLATKSYLVYLNLDTMKASIQEDYTYGGSTALQQTSRAVADAPGYPAPPKWLVATTISLILITIVVLYASHLIRKNKT